MFKRAHISSKRGLHTTLIRGIASVLQRSLCQKYDQKKRERRLKDFLQKKCKYKVFKALKCEHGKRKGVKIHKFHFGEFAVFLPVYSFLSHL